MSTPLHIATLGEESFKYGTATLIHSILQSCSAPELRFLILDLNLKAPTRRALAETLRKSGRKAEIEFLNPADSEAFQAIMELTKQRKWTFLKQCWFSKLALPDLLCRSIDHVFYLDSDVYCAMDLATPGLMGGQPLCAVLDGPITHSGHSIEFEIERLDADAPFFNSGVVGLNLRYWQANGFSEKAVVLTEKYAPFRPELHPPFSEKARAVIATHGLGFGDQAVFNILYYRNWQQLPPEWNRQSPFRYGGFAEIESGGKFNLHYVTNPKPWQVPVEPATAFFYKALDQTAFRGYRPNPLYWGLHLKLRTLKYKLGKRLAELKQDKVPR